MNVFQRIAMFGHDEDFEPQPGPMYLPTNSSPGSMEKINVLALRVDLGLPLWHPKDERVCSVVCRAQLERAGCDYPVRSKVVSGRGKGLID